jgi:hypothetical protein
MFTISSDALLGKITIYDSFGDVNSPKFHKSGDTYTISFSNLRNVKIFNKFGYNTKGTTNYRYLVAQYRVSKDSFAWTPWSKLDSVVDNFPPFDTKYPMFIDIKWTRVGDSEIGIIELINYVLIGNLDRPTMFLSNTDNEINTDNEQPSYSYPPSHNPQGINISKNEVIFIAVTGIQGPMGPFGLGPQGPHGPTGFQGYQGRQGTQGTQGFQGSGATGPQGVSGITGNSRFVFWHFINWNSFLL